MNPQDPKYLHKSKSKASPEQNYFAHFAMRYPVPTYMPIFVLRLIFIRNVLFVNCYSQFYRLSLMRTMNYFFNY